MAIMDPESHRTWEQAPNKPTVEDYPTGTILIDWWGRKAIVRGHEQGRVLLETLGEYRPGEYGLRMNRCSPRLISRLFHDDRHDALMGAIQPGCSAAR